MNITLHTIKIGELVEGYADGDEAGVVGYGGRLDIRPPHQRELNAHASFAQAKLVA